MAFFGWVLVNGVLKFGGTAQVTTMLLGDGSGSAPSLTFASDPDTGIFWGTSGTTSITSNGTTAFTFGGADFFRFSFGNDVVLTRDGAANALGMRNTTNPQVFRIYNTFTSLTDFERLEIGSSVAGQAANTFGIIPTKGSSGTLRDLIIGSSIGLTVLNSSRVNVIGKLDFTVAASTFAQTATMTNGPRAANPVNWVEVSYNGGTTGRIPIW